MSKKMIHALCKIGGLITMIIWLNLPVSAQKKLNNSETDTIYYNFYNDIQMIEIFYNFPPSQQAIMDYHHRASTMGSIPHPPSSYHFSVYVFRNSKGEIISVFNQKKEKVKADDFVPITSLNGNSVYHNRIPKKKAITNHLYIRKYQSYFDYLDVNDSDSIVNKIFLEFYTVYDVNSIPSKQLPDDFSKLTQDEYNLLRQSKTGIIDTLGNVILNPVYDKIIAYDSLFLMSKDEKFSFLPLSSRCISVEYDKYKLISKNIFAVQSNNLWGFVNPYGQLIVELSYDNIYYPAYSEFSSDNKNKDKYITVTQNNKQGLLDTSLKEILPIEFSTVSTISFNERDFFIVTVDGKKGVFNDELKLIIPIKYEDWIFPSLRRNTFFVKENGKHGVFDLEGNIILPTEYDNIVGHGYTTYTVRKGNKYGIYDSYMNRIYPIELDGHFEILNKGTQHPYYLIKKDGKLGIYNSENNTILEPQYDRIVLNPNKGFFVYIDGKQKILDLDFK